MELARLTKLANFCPGPQVGIVHRTNPTYVEIPEQTFSRHHTLKNDGMESFAFVIVCSMQSGSNDGYVGAIDSPHHVRNLVKVLELLCILLHGGRWRPVDEFPKEVFFFMATQNSDIAIWLDDRPIMYKSAMHCMELPEANLVIDTTIFTCTGMARRMFVSRLCKSGARLLHKYSNVETSIRMRPLNSLELNEPNKFWSKKPGLCKPRLWAHSRRCRLPLHSLNPCNASVMQHSCCQCHKKLQFHPWPYTPTYWTMTTERWIKVWDSVY